MVDDDEILTDLIPVTVVLLIDYSNYSSPILLDPDETSLEIFFVPASRYAEPAQERSSWVMAENKCAKCEKLFKTTGDSKKISQFTLAQPPNKFSVRDLVVIHQIFFSVGDLCGN